MKNILVTGGAGFIGTNLIKSLIEKGFNVVSIDNYSTGSKSNEIQDVKYYNLDIENGERKGCYNITFSDQQNNLIEIGVCKDIGSFTKSDFIILLDGNLPESQYGIELSTLKMKNNPNTNDDFYLILYNAFFYSGVHLKMNES